MKINKLLVVIGLCTLPTVAMAGYTQSAPVDVNLEDKFAGGDMLTARWTKGDETFIGCGIRHIDTGSDTFKFGFCQATDEDGEMAFCNTTNAGLLESMHATADGSYVTFSWNDDGECTRIGFSTQSFYLNKDNPSFVNKNKNENL